jgi:hypothetical protein
MDESTRDPRLMEVIAASEAMTNARVELEAAREAGAIDDARWEGIYRYVFPILEAEGARLGVEYRRLREGA